MSGRAAKTPTIGLRARKKNRVRRELYLRSLDLFRQHGYQNTTIDMIAAAADQSRSTFFNYFGLKEEILFRLIENGVRFVTLAIRRAQSESENFEEAFFRILSDIAVDLKKDKPLYAGVFQELMFVEVSSDPAKRRRGISRICEPLAQIFARARKNGELDFKGNAGQLAELFFGTLFSVCLSFVYAERMDLDKRLRAAGELFLDGVRSR